VHGQVDDGRFKAGAIWQNLGDGTMHVPANLSLDPHEPELPFWCTLIRPIEQQPDPNPPPQNVLSPESVQQRNGRPASLGRSERDLSSSMASPHILPGLLSNMLRFSSHKHMLCVALFLRLGRLTFSRYWVDNSLPFRKSSTIACIFLEIVLPSRPFGPSCALSLFPQT
jgi:hypothetical protein